MISVKATREGLVGQRTSTGWIIDTITPFVALPSTKAKLKRVKLRNPANGKMCAATVLDTGPWLIDDDAYVFQAATQRSETWASFATATRPLAESGIKWNGQHRIEGHTNGAGIDLGERVWSLLGMHDNSDIEWEFI